MQTMLTSLSVLSTKPLSESTGERWLGFWACESRWSPLQVFCHTRQNQRTVVHNMWFTTCSTQISLVAGLMTSCVKACVEANLLQRARHAVLTQQCFAKKQDLCKAVMYTTAGSRLAILHLYDV